MRNCRIHDNLADGIYLEKVAAAPRLENLVVADNGGAGIVQGLATMSPVYRNLTLRRNGTDAVAVTWGWVDQDTTWGAADMGAPFQMNTHLNIPTGRILTLSPGTTVRFVTGTVAYVNGALYALATATAPITLTAAVDQPGVWGGVQVAPGATVLFDLSLIHI